MENQNKLIDEHIAAEHLGVSLSTLRRDRSGHTNIGIPYVRIGGCIRYRLFDLDQWVTSSTSQAKPADPQTLLTPPVRGRGRGRPRKMLA